MADAIRLQGVTKRFGAFTAVDRLDLRVPAGGVLGFLGPNGAGKTTTIRMIMDITMPDSGELEVLGSRRASEVKDRIGYLPEERGLYRKMTVNDTLRYLGRLKGMHGPKLQERIDSGLLRLGLSDWKSKKVEALSKGMSQKLQFLTATMHDPELVILDEPFSGLDPVNADLLQRMVAEMRAAGTTVIFSTHQMETAERLCDRIVLINRGHKLLDGTLAEIREQFTSRIVTVEGEGDLGSLAQLPGVLDALVTGGTARLEVTPEVRPEDLLKVILDRVRVRKFEVQRPGLQEIFVKMVGGDQAMLAEASSPSIAPIAAALLASALALGGRGHD